ncbi:MAG: hypothetical protein ACLTQR_03570 [Methanobrevibacter smithii]
MFWKTEHEYNIIEDISVEELEEFLTENHIYLDLMRAAERWAAFSNYYGRKHGLNELEAASFSSIISTFMAGMGVSASTDAYFNEEAIEGKVIDLYNQLPETADEISRKRMLFSQVFDLYKNNLEKYELKNRRIEVRVTEMQYHKFLDLPGETKSDKFRNLLKGDD